MWQRELTAPVARATDSPEHVSKVKGFGKVPDLSLALKIDKLEVFKVVDILRRFGARHIKCLRKSYYKTGHVYHSRQGKFLHSINRSLLCLISIRIANLSSTCILLITRVWTNV